MSNSGLATVETCTIAISGGGHVQRELAALLSTRVRCFKLGEESNAAAIAEQIEARQALLLRMEDVRQRIMHERFAGLNISLLRAPGRNTRLNRGR
jgi:hypothetical protein